LEILQLDILIFPVDFIASKDYGAEIPSFLNYLGYHFFFMLNEETTLTKSKIPGFSHVERMPVLSFSPKYFFLLEKAYIYILFV